MFTNDLEAQQALSQGNLHWAKQALIPKDLMTSSSRFDGEWLFGTYMMASLGFGQTALTHPTMLERHRDAMDTCIERLLNPQTRRFDTVAWGSDALEDLGTARAHAAYLGYLNLVLSMRASLGPSPYAELGARISNHLQQALLASPQGLVETYPGETYPVDNAAVIGSLALHQRMTGVDHGEVLKRWNTGFENLRDPDTGLLIQAVGPAGEVVDGPRGSGTALAVYFLSFANMEQSLVLYNAVKSELHQEFLGFGVVREYPAGVNGRGDIDSGPIVMGLSISATGFSLAGARIHSDPTAFADLWATASLFGAPVDRGGARNFALGGPLGDALMFAMLTARPAQGLEGL